MYGEGGPRAELLGVGMTISAVTGLMWSTGYRPDDPVGPGTHYPDHAANPYHAAFAVLAALRRKRLTGEGMKIDLSQVESTINFIGTAVTECAMTGHDRPQTGNGSVEMAPAQHFPLRRRGRVGGDRGDGPTANGQALARVIDGTGLWIIPASLRRPTASRGATNWSVLVSAWTITRDADEAALALRQAGVPAARVANSRYLIESDPQLAARSYWQRVEHPELGNSLYASPPYRIDGERVELARPPLLGEHNREIPTGLLGLDAQEIDRLEASGVFK